MLLPQCLSFLLQYLYFVYDLHNNNRLRVGPVASADAGARAYSICVWRVKRGPGAEAAEQRWLSVVSLSD